MYVAMNCRGETMEMYAGAYVLLGDVYLDWEQATVDQIHIVLDRISESIKHQKEALSLT
ncbi:hypothetical protein GSbR_41950 [Geobacter sp. SVR]|nr:hypothetical protein GSVR_24190 [Geobacter sp. SVR]GCF87595.1 hypothetical protein GSbR_41950 [Geobacter sp. SVR]